MDARFLLAPAAALSACLLLGCHGGGHHANNGAAIGGVLGAVTGAAIGHQNNEALAGALIGGAVGGLTGSAIGDGMDHAEARQAYLEQRVGRAMAGAVTNEDILAMTHAGVGDSVIIAHVQSKGLARPLGTGDIISLKQSGVSDAVLAVMQRTPLAADMAQPVVVPASRPVIVEEHYWGPPRPVYYHYHRGGPRHWHGPPRYRGGTHFGFSISN